tara:strand:+ start:11853 stop:13445 length:1593 start_codon:yes stop_codon:yes gene_type:complete
MATIKWAGGTSTDASVAANWVGGALPTSSDVVSFTGSVSNICDMTNLSAETYQKITVVSDYNSTVTFSSQTITLTDGVGLEINKAGVFNCGSNVIFDFTGTPTGNAYNSDGSTTGQPLYTVKIDSSNDTNLDTSPTGVFIDETDRSNTTFVFKNSSATLKMYLMDGVYPNVKFEPTAATTFDTRNAFDTYTASDINTLSKMNEYGKVNMLNFTVTDTDITVSAGSKNYDDLNKIFKIKGSIATIGANTFDWGYATLELEPTANSTIPCTGSTTHGSGFFKAHYHKLVIEESTSNSYYYLLETDLRLNCNDLIVNGRLYGNSDYNSSADTTAEIHTVKSPTINGDWNFQQVSDGIYRARGTLELSPVAYGGTGRRFLTTDSVLYGRGSNEVGLTTKILHPIFFERSAIDTSAVDFRSPTATGATAYPNAFPMPYAGKVVAATFLFAGSAITTTGNTNVIRIRKNGGTSGSDINDVSFNEGDLTNTNGTNYSLVETGLTFSFSAGDVLQVKRQSGATDLNNGQAILWVKFDY